MANRRCVKGLVAFKGGRLEVTYSAKLARLEFPSVHLNFPRDRGPAHVALGEGLRTRRAGGMAAQEDGRLAVLQADRAQEFLLVVLDLGRQHVRLSLGFRIGCGGREDLFGDDDVTS